jgi:two-component system chemotaxis response regulator CheY
MQPLETARGSPKTLSGPRLWPRSLELAALKTCLVVDDSRVIRKVARRIIEDLGFEIAEAADGMEAMAWCRTAMPEAILLDWNMPVMDGMEFLRQLRAEPEGKTPVVIVCSVENEPSMIAQALEAGADEYIMKPFDGDIIISKFAQSGLVMERAA